MARSNARLMVILAALLGTSLAGAAERTYDRTLVAPPGDRLRLDTNVGSVAVAGGDAAQVVVHVEMEGSESFLARFHVNAEQTPAGVTISAHGGDHGWLGWFGWFDFNSSRVRFTIEVPRGYSVDLRTSGGGVDVKDLTAPVQARTAGGSIRAQLRANHGIKLVTSGGSITLLLPRNTEASIDAATSGGRVSSDLSLSTIRISSSDHLVGHIGGGGALISLHTSGGSIHIEPAN